MENMRTWIGGMAVVTCGLLVACSSDGGGEGKSAPIEKASVSGIIEKGPFVQGSKVLLYELEADLTQTGKSFRTQTTSDLGAFNFTPDKPMELSSQYVELETSGYFYNEVKGQLSNSPITLNALSNISVRNSINVNLLTHLEFDRVKKLVRGGKDFNSAKKQAERELLACFGITTEIASPEGVSITDNNKNSAILLAISTIMLYERSEAEFSELIAKFSTDFADNGSIDNESVRAAIKEGEEHAHPCDVIEQMKEFYANKGITFECDDFSKFVDFDGNGVIDENDKEVDDEPSNTVIDERYYYDPAKVQTMLASAYSETARFAYYQNVIDNVRLGKTDAFLVINIYDPYDATISDAWSSAYTAITRLNTLIVGMQYWNGDDQTKLSYLREAVALRSFLYYNLAMMWGNVPEVKEDADVMEYPQQKSRNELLTKTLDNLYSMRILDEDYIYYSYSDSKYHLDGYKRLVLIGEMHMALGNKNEARSILQGILADNVYFYLKNMQTRNVQLGDDPSTSAEPKPIYTPAYLQLLLQELNSSDATQMATLWRQSEQTYGTWAALNRLGQAQSISECEDYQLLLPIPASEINTNPYLRQNPGYPSYGTR